MPTATRCCVVASFDLSSSASWLDWLPSMVGCLTDCHLSWETSLDFTTIQLTAATQEQKNNEYKDNEMGANTNAMQRSFDIPPQQQKCLVQRCSYSNYGGFSCPAKRQNTGPAATEMSNAMVQLQQCWTFSSATNGQYWQCSVNNWQHCYSNCGGFLGLLLCRQCTK